VFLHGFLVGGDVPARRLRAPQLNRGVSLHMCYNIGLRCRVVAADAAAIRPARGLSHAVVRHHVRLQCEVVDEVAAAVGAVLARGHPFVLRVGRLHVVEQSVRAVGLFPPEHGGPTRPGVLMDVRRMEKRLLNVGLVNVGPGPRAGHDAGHGRGGAPADGHAVAVEDALVGAAVPPRPPVERAPGVPHGVGCELRRRRRELAAATSGGRHASAIPHTQHRCYHFGRLTIQSPQLNRQSRIRLNALSRPTTIAQHPTPFPTFSSSCRQTLLSQSALFNPLVIRKRFSFTNSEVARSPLSFPQTPFFFRSLRSTICNPKRSRWMGMPRISNGGPERARKRSVGERGEIEQTRNTVSALAIARFDPNIGDHFSNFFLLVDALL